MNKRKEKGPGNYGEKPKVYFVLFSYGRLYKPKSNSMEPIIMNFVGTSKWIDNRHNWTDQLQEIKAKNLKRKNVKYISIPKENSKRHGQ